MNTQSIRDNRLQNARQTAWDIIVIGGGITGVGIGLQAAKNGLSVLLLEQKDFAWGTSSRSSKMIHGGLRYLASGNLKLTRHSVKEREWLLQQLPGLVERMNYLWPHYQKQFPGPFIFNALLRVYETFSGHSRRRYWKAQEATYLAPYLSTQKLLGLTQFTDAVADDVRLVFRLLNEFNDYAECDALNYVKVANVDSEASCLQGTDQLSGRVYSFKAKVLINATGAWVDQLTVVKSQTHATKRHSAADKRRIRPCRGSHLVFARWQLPVYAALTFKHPEDGRALFIYPWESVAIVGTTDIDHPHLDDSEVGISAEEMSYLLQAVNTLFPSLKLGVNDIISTWAGVRPLVRSGNRLNPSSEKRDHSIWVNNRLVTVSGGKLTTFRLIAIEVLKKVETLLGRKFSNTKDAYFTQPELYGDFINSQPVSATTWKRLLGTYGNHAKNLILEAAPEDLECIPGMNRLWAELKWSLAHEDVVFLDDLLIRRTRIGQMIAKGGAPFYTRIKSSVQSVLGWSDDQWNQQWTRYQDIWKCAYSIPTKKQTPTNKRVPAEQPIPNQQTKMYSLDNTPNNPPIEKNLKEPSLFTTDKRSLVNKVN